MAVGAPDGAERGKGLGLHKCRPGRSAVVFVVSEQAENCQP